ncbi:metal-dependent transcriptional regulator [Anaeromicropila populeti]|uniref:Iron (Metal) dependent repressor, DtxR family n=1 Tax=Anaeromicropila populeti TaxID=37658 RepID=A0A1I6IP65_9FIRM|nr:metal-dependent transcriptional regulator [Anaeromicropila populeti]SFR68514.1 iron (metal) dependent repressor, DtxR family [Anaeromicropila populeti]
MYESGENYLETILMLKNRNGSVRSIEIARELGFSKPSVCRAMGILKESGHIVMDAKGEITLTKLGLEKANSVLERHLLLTEFLILTTGVDRSTAEADACKMEHIICDEVFQGIKLFLEKTQGVTS